MANDAISGNFSLTTRAQTPTDRPDTMLPFQGEIDAGSIAISRGKSPVDELRRDVSKGSDLSEGRVPAQRRPLNRLSQWSAFYWRTCFVISGLLGFISGAFPVYS